jgi:hypothetical protein
MEDTKMLGRCLRCRGREESEEIKEEDGQEKIRLWRRKTNRGE